MADQFAYMNLDPLVIGLRDEWGTPFNLSPNKAVEGDWYARYAHPKGPLSMVHRDRVLDENVIRTAVPRDAEVAESWQHVFDKVDPILFQLPELAKVVLPSSLDEDPNKMTWTAPQENGEHGEVFPEEPPLQIGDVFMTGEAEDMSDAVTYRVVDITEDGTPVCEKVETNEGPAQQEAREVEAETKPEVDKAPARKNAPAKGKKGKAKGTKK